MNIIRVEIKFGQITQIKKGNGYQDTLNRGPIRRKIIVIARKKIFLRSIPTTEHSR